MDNCVYCDITETKRTGKALWCDLPETSMVLYIDLSGTSYITVEGVGEEPWFEVSHCPKCGRELEVKHGFNK